MTPLAADLLVLFRRDLRCFVREVELFPDDATLWKTLPGISNSAGNLALHVAGNLRHFVGGVLGGTGYQRNREQEFAQRDGTRMAVSAALEAASIDIQAGLEKLTPEIQEAPFPVSVGGQRPATGRLLLHLAAHTAFHLGQAGYLRRALTGSSTSASPMDLRGLDDRV
jgi:uncharacterized damage-inducible protein DinB